MVVDQKKSMRWGPLTGVVFVVMLIVSFFITSTPDSSASGASVITYYSAQSNKRAANITSVLIDLSVVFGLFFFGYLRDRLRHSDIGERLAPIAFGGAVIFATGGLLTSGTTLALTDVPKKLTPAAAQALNILSNDLFDTVLVIGISVLTLATGIIILRSRLLPVWIGWLSIVIGVVAIAGPLGFFALPATAIWILILCAYFSLVKPTVARSQPEPEPTRPESHAPGA